MSKESERTRLVEVVVLGVNTGDEYALVETLDGTQEQFVVRRELASSCWSALSKGHHAWLSVTAGLLGRVHDLSLTPPA